MLDSLKESLQAAIRRFAGSNIPDETAVNDLVKDLQRALIQADVNAKLVLELTERLRRRAIEEKIPKGISRKDQVVSMLYDELAGLLGKEGGLSLDRSERTTIVMLGVQGSGKTTTTAKLARYYAKRGFSVGVVAADTFRPAAAKQLRDICAASGIEVYSDEKETDPARIVREAKDHYKNSKNLVIVDTAGRHKDEPELLKEMGRILAEIKPEVILLVIDGTVGQQSYKQALAFHQVSPVGGIVVTKLDGAAKGGGALAAAVAAGARIFYLGVGERIDDIEEFSPTRFVGRLLGMGDLQALTRLVRDAQADSDQEGMQRIVHGQMTLNDFIRELRNLKKMGPIDRIFELLPSNPALTANKDVANLQGKVKAWTAMYDSMTVEERASPEIIKSSRVARIARGSGTSEREVREMLARFKQTKDAIKKAGRSRELRKYLRGVNSA